MKIVADTSTILAVALNEPEKKNIIRLTKRCDLIAPAVLPFEVGNALAAMAKRNALRQRDALTAWELVQRIPVELCDVDIRSALDIALQLKVYAYDAYFLECAVRSRCPLITLDRGMQRIATDLGITILE